MPLSYLRVAALTPPVGNASGVSVYTPGGLEANRHTTFPIEGGPLPRRIPVVYKRHLGGFVGVDAYQDMQNIRVLRPTLQRYFRRVEYTRLRTVAESARQPVGPGNLPDFRSIFPVDTSRR